MEPVKSRRVYNSRGRQEQARRTRDAILDVARKRFLTDGYAATTMPSIATEVGVSVDTVHKAFGGKAGLVRAIYQRSLDGSGPVAAPRRSDQMQHGETDPHAIVRQWGTLTTEVAPLVAPVHLLIRDAAATDSEMAALLRDSDDQRRERMRHNAHTLADRGHLAPGVTIEDATDVMWTYSSPELFELLVLRCGWDYGAIRTVPWPGDRRGAAAPGASTCGRRRPPTSWSRHLSRVSDYRPGALSVVSARFSMASAAAIGPPAALNPAATRATPSAMFLASHTLARRRSPVRRFAERRSP